MACGIFEGPKTIIAGLNEATLLVFDDYTKERCIAAYLLAKKVIQLAKPLPFDSIVQLPKDIDSVMSFSSEFQDFLRGLINRY
ncbi:conserved hypothetical protein [Ricinus communis]|uniref:Uncharacterized protein n=1 Tax=Ricinus communis TaxID=3988 RepID=B9T9T2_RICCO|nr:conserved hypothetical protein [Ricinus communis]